MATAYPTQLYEIVSEEEALSRNARQYPRQYPRQNPQPVYFPQQPVIMPAPVMPGNPPIMAPAPGQRCEQKCQWSYFQQRQICDWHCPRM